MKIIAPFVCLAEWKQDKISPFADGSALTFDGAQWTIDASVRGGRRIESVLVLVDQHGALTLLQAADMAQPLAAASPTLARGPLQLVGVAPAGALDCPLHERHRIRSACEMRCRSDGRSPRAQHKRL
jgi:hypothetical protein